MHADATGIPTLVPMARLLDGLGIGVNTRTRRAPCILHGGSNPHAFSWREDGRWYCFACGAGGDKLALVRAVRQCSFREAVEFLAAIAGVEYRARKISRAEIALHRQHRERAERAAWRIRDEALRLRVYYTDALHRAERLQRKIGEGLWGAGSEAEREHAWDRLARLAPVCTYFLAGWYFLNYAQPAELAWFALASPAERRRVILEGSGQ